MKCELCGQETGCERSIRIIPKLDVNTMRMSQEVCWLSHCYCDVCSRGRASGEEVKTWTVVMAELKPGLASTGLRINKSDTIQFFALHDTPAQAAKLTADIARGKITLEDIAKKAWFPQKLPSNLE